MQLGDTAAAHLVAVTDPADAAAQNNLGVILQRAGRLTDAERAFDRAVALDSAMTVARHNLRALPDDAARTSAAARRGRVRLDASDDDAWRAVVRHHAARAEFDIAAEVLARWEETAPISPAPHVERARCALDAGRPERALDAVACARRLTASGADISDPASVIVLDLLEARAKYQQGDAAGALATIERVHDAAPGDAEAELLRSFLLGELGASRAAAAGRARAAALDPALARVDPGIAAETQRPAPEPLPAGTSAPHAPAPGETSRVADRVLAMAVALRHKGYYDEARRILEPLVDDAEPGARVAVRAALGLTHLMRGAPRAAVPLLASVVAEGHRSAEQRGSDLLALAVAHLLAHDAEGADAAARRAMDGEAALLVRSAAGAVRALAAWRRGDLAEARRHLLGAAALARPLDARIRATLAGNLALLLVAAGAAPAAVAAGAAAVRLTPHAAVAHVAHGHALAATGDHQATRTAFARACELAPRDAAARYGLAFAAAACADHEAARVELARATALSPVVRAPTAPLIVVGDGAVLIPSDGSAAVAGEAAGTSGSVASDEAHRANLPANSYAHVDARLAAGEYERALAAAEATLARGAPRADGLLRAGHALARSGQATLALQRYTEAAAAAPDSVDAELHLVRALYDAGRLAEARARAAAAGDRWPADLRLTAIHARAAADCGAAADAAAALDRCAAAEGADAPPSGCNAASDIAAFWTDVAGAWQALASWHDAARAWDCVARATPAAVRPWLARAQALARAGDRDGADATLESIAERAPEHPDVLRVRAELAIASGRLAAARAHLARVVVRDAEDVDALAALGAVYADAGRIDDARLAVARALRLDPEHPTALAVAGTCAAADGDVTAACDLWVRSLGVSPVGAGAARARAGLRTHASHVQQFA